MARKSRKIIQKENQSSTILTQSVAKATTLADTAAYVRLSVDKGEDESLQTQIQLLHQYIDSHRDLRLTDTYVDNGYTGTNFDRPEFNRLMEDVRSGKVQCIVVKDLSRFGRDFLETGYYIETIFPHLNVRFISVNDDFDSDRLSDRDNIAIPIKNMVNEMYAKDFSRKQTAYFELHSKLGDAKILRSIYGFSLNREKNILEENPETAQYVRIIFRWFMMGHGNKEIVDRLNLLKVLTPCHYKAVYEEGKSVPETDCWRSDRVKTILRNQSYIGDTVQGKRRKILYKNLNAYHAKPNEWIIHKDTHEPIIKPEDFVIVQEKLDLASEKKKQRLEELKDNREQFKDFFSQKVKCMKCGRTMQYSRYSHLRYSQGLHGAEYICRGDDLQVGCRQRVHEDYLKILVCDQIHLLIQAMSDRKELLLKMKNEGSDKGVLASVNLKINGLYYRLNQAEESSSTLYENLAEGIIDENDYRYMKEHYILEKQKLQTEIMEAEGRKREIERCIDQFLDWESHLEKNLESREFDVKLVDELIEAIYISPDEKVEIRFRCEDIYKRIQTLLEDGEVE